MFKILAQKSKAMLSLPNCRRVRGYEIKRLPIGGYIAAMQKLQDFPKEAIAGIFPGMNLDGIITQCKTITTDAVTEIIIRAFSIIPQQAAVLVSALTDIPEDSLLNDPKIGLDGLAEIMNVWLDINGIENFIKAARGLREKLKAQAAENTTSKG